MSIFGLAAGAATGGWWPLIRLGLVYVLPWLIVAGAVTTCNRVRASWIAQHEEDVRAIGAVTADRDHAVLDAKACSDGVTKLREESRRAQTQRDAAISKSVVAAKALRAQAEKQSQVTLQRPPTHVAAPGAPPGEVTAAACASMTDLLTQKLAERAAARKVTP